MHVRQHSSSTGFSHRLPYTDGFIGMINPGQTSLTPTQHNSKIYDSIHHTSHHDHLSGLQEQATEGRLTTTLTPSHRYRHVRGKKQKFHRVEKLRLTFVSLDKVDYTYVAILFISAFWSPAVSNCYPEEEFCSLAVVVLWDGDGCCFPGFPHRLVCHMKYNNRTR